MAAGRLPTSSGARRSAATRNACTAGARSARRPGALAGTAAARHLTDGSFPGAYKVTPTGVAVARFRRAVPMARWQAGAANLLFGGRHEPRKGLLDLLKAYRILRKRGCNCRL